MRRRMGPRSRAIPPLRRHAAAQALERERWKERYEALETLEPKRLRKGGGTAQALEEGGTARALDGGRSSAKRWRREEQRKRWRGEKR